MFIELIDTHTHTDQICLIPDMLKQTYFMVHSKVRRITYRVYREGKLLCDYDELVKLQLRRRVMGEETSAV